MPPPSKRRKVAGVEEVKFDTTAREDYLTGFHKRKLQRIKHAKEENTKKDRALRVEARKQLREQRKKDLEIHVETVNALVRKAVEGESEEDSDEEVGEVMDIPFSGDSGEIRKDGIGKGREDEYVDEDRHTTVTVEPLNLSASEEDDVSEDNQQSDAKPGIGGKVDKGKPANQTDGLTQRKRTWTKEKPAPSKPKKKRKSFRYESKVERKDARNKQRIKNNAAAKARRET